MLSNTCHTLSKFFHKLSKEWNTMICCVRNLICCAQLDNIWIAMYFSDKTRAMRLLAVGSLNTRTEKAGLPKPLANRWENGVVSVTMPKGPELCPDFGRHGRRGAQWSSTTITVIIIGGIQIRWSSPSCSRTQREREQTTWSLSAPMPDRSICDCYWWYGGRLSSVSEPMFRSRCGKLSHGSSGNPPWLLKKSGSIRKIQACQGRDCPNLWVCKSSR